MLSKPAIGWHWLVRPINPGEAFVLTYFVANQVELDARERIQQNLLNQALALTPTMSRYLDAGTSIEPEEVNLLTPGITARITLIDASGKVAKLAGHLVFRNDPKANLIADENHRSLEGWQYGNQFLAFTTAADACRGEDFLKSLAAVGIFRISAGCFRLLNSGARIASGS